MFRVGSQHQTLRGELQLIQIGISAACGVAYLQHLTALDKATTPNPLENLSLMACHMQIKALDARMKKCQRQTASRVSQNYTHYKKLRTSNEE